MCAAMWAAHNESESVFSNALTVVVLCLIVLLPPSGHDQRCGYSGMTSVDPARTENEKPITWYESQSLVDGDFGAQS